MTKNTKSVDNQYQNLLKKFHINSYPDQINIKNKFGLVQMDVG